jgi:PRA1 family protein 1
MASAPTSSPLLPVTNPASGLSLAAAGGSDAPIATPAFRLFLSRISDSARRSLSDRRPWGELLDRSAFSKPDSLSDTTSRLRRNLAYFRVNYAAVVAFALGASLLAHPFLPLILLGLLAAWCFLYLFRPSDQPVVLFGRTFSDHETLLGLVGASFILLFFTSVALAEHYDIENTENSVRIDRSAKARLVYVPVRVFVTRWFYMTDTCCVGAVHHVTSSGGS